MENKPRQQFTSWGINRLSEGRPVELQAFVETADSEYDNRHQVGFTVKLNAETNEIELHCGGMKVSLPLKPID